MSGHSVHRRRHHLKGRKLSRRVPSVPIDYEVRAVLEFAGAIIAGERLRGSRGAPYSKGSNGKAPNKSRVKREASE